MKTITNIYLDMDGVICDFDEGYKKCYGLNCRDDPEEYHWYEFVENKGFENLNPMKDMTLLMDYLYTLDVNITILSCVSNRRNHRSVRLQKNRWLINYNLGHLPAIFTRTKLEKSDYANGESILIDDSYECVRPFAMAGGHMVWHKSAKETIIELEKLKEESMLCALSLAPAI